MMQGSPEWLALRKTKITATDIPIILGENKWKTPVELYLQKIDPFFQETENDAMRRGTQLEPFARELFSIETGIETKPQVVIKDWAMASLDGLSECKRFAVEIKCPGKKYHDMAKENVVPLHYYGQLQHQMFVCDLDSIYYYSFDGLEGVTIKLLRSDTYTKRLIEKGKLFYDLMMERNLKMIQENF
jgi:putative phage-type endonuclease